MQKLASSLVSLGCTSEMMVSTAARMASIEERLENSEVRKASKLER